MAAAAGGTRFAVPMPAASVSAAAPGGAALPSATMMPTLFFQQAGGGLLPSTAATHHQLQLAAAAAAAASSTPSTPSTSAGGGAGAATPHAMQQQRLQQVGQPLGLPPAQHMMQQGATISIIPPAQTTTQLQHTGLFRSQPDHCPLTSRPLVFVIRFTRTCSIVSLPQPLIGSYDQHYLGFIGI